MFTLAISCLNTSNLPRFMDLTIQVPMQYCSLQHQALLPLPVMSTTGCCFLWFHLFILFWVSSPLISSSILSTYWPGEFIFQRPIFLPFHTAAAPLRLYNGSDKQIQGIRSDRVSEELWIGVSVIVQEAVIKTTPKKKKCKKAGWLSEEALQIAEKTREAKGKEKRKDIPIWIQSSK